MAKTFTIQVKKRDANEDFRFEDMQLFHGECNGGRIESTPHNDYAKDKGWQLICARCYSSQPAHSETKLAIAKTATDGKKRKVENLVNMRWFAGVTLIIPVQ